MPLEDSNLWLDIDVDHCLYQLKQLEKRVLSIHERSMRRTLVVEFASGLTPTELVFSLNHIHTRAFHGNPTARELMQEFALEPSAVSQLSYDTLKEAYSIAHERNLENIRGLFFSGSTGEQEKPIQHMDTQGIPTNEHLELPLGWRRKAARESDRNVLDRLLHDQNWRVIDLLLDNPRITERDVVKIAARRPTQPVIIDLVAKHSKWSGRYKVRKAIVCNPKTPYSLARSLLDTLLQQDIRDVIGLGVLDGRLLDEARLLLRRRAGEVVEDTQDAMGEMEALIAQFDSDLQQEADWITEIEQKEQEDVDNWMDNITQGLIEGSLPLIPVGDEVED